MIIKKDNNLLLVRYKDYKKNSFIDEHIRVLNNKDYVWILKSGKIPDKKKIEIILNDGGYILLKSPKSQGNKCYLAKFTNTSDKHPEDRIYPEYYDEYLNEGNNNGIWFKVTSVQSVDYDFVNKLVLAKDNKNAVDIINSTMTSFMFVKTVIDIEI